MIKTQRHRPIAKKLFSFAFGLTCLIQLPLGCSLSRQSAVCQDTSECKSEFGVGFVCAESGLCEQPPVQADCQTQSPVDLLLNPSAYTDYVVFGSLLRNLGKEGARQDSALLALDAVNHYLDSEASKRAQLETLRFGMVQCSHDGDTDKVTDLASYLVDTLETPAIVGPATSSGTENAYTQVNLFGKGQNLEKTLFISPSATSVGLTQLDSTSPGLLWRTAPTDDGQSLVMAEHAKSLNDHFAIVYEDTTYGRGLYGQLKDSTSNQCNNCGIKFVPENDANTQLAAALNANEARSAIRAAHTIFFIGAQEENISHMMGLLGTQDYKGKFIFFSDAAASLDSVNRVKKENYERVIGTRVRSPAESEAFNIFSAVYEAKTDESPNLHSFTANAYDAAWLIMLATIRAQLRGDPLTAKHIAEGMRHLSSATWKDLSAEQCPSKLNEGQCPPLTLDEANLGAMIEGLESRGSIDVTGASGDLDYDAKTEELKDSHEAFERWKLAPLNDDEGFAIISWSTDESTPSPE